MLTKEDVRERLRTHEECIEVEILGETYPFCLTTLGAKHLRSEGIQVVDAAIGLIRRAVDAYDELKERYDVDAQDLRSGNVDIEVQELATLFADYLEDDDIELLSVVTYWGLRPFDDDIELEAVQMIPLGEQVMLIPTIFGRLFSFVQDETDEFNDALPDAEADASGDGDGGN